MTNNYKKLIKKLKRTVEIESFLENILEQFYFYLNQDDVSTQIENNTICLKIKDIEISIKVENNEVVYTKKQNLKKEIQKYNKIENGYLIRISEESQNIFELEDYYSIHNTMEKKIKVYDNSKKEIYRRKTKKAENFNEDKMTRLRTLHEPNVLKNFTENEYSYRIEDKYIIKRTIRKYAHPDDIKLFANLKDLDEIYLRYETINEQTNEIPNWGNYYAIDKSVFFDYKQSKATSDDIVENFYSKKYYTPYNHNV